MRFFSRASVVGADQTHLLNPPECAVRTLGKNDLCLDFIERWPAVGVPVSASEEPLT
jgi:hypothetical protein